MKNDQVILEALAAFGNDGMLHITVSSTSSPQVVSGDPSSWHQPGFPIKVVGNDTVGCPIKTFLNDGEERKTPFERLATFVWTMCTDEVCFHD